MRPLPAGPRQESPSSPSVATPAKQVPRPPCLPAERDRRCRRPPGSPAPVDARAPPADRPASGRCRACRRRAPRDPRSSTPDSAPPAPTSRRPVRPCPRRRPVRPPRRRDAVRPGRRSTPSPHTPGRDGDRAGRRDPRSTRPGRARRRRAGRCRWRQREPRPRDLPSFPPWPRPATRSAGLPAAHAGRPGLEMRRNGPQDLREPCPHRGGSQSGPHPGIGEWGRLQRQGCSGRGHGRIV